VSFTSVSEALNESFIQSVNASNRCMNEHAKMHLLYGVGRRLQIIRRNFCSISSITDKDRKAPVDDEEQVELNLHINSLYLHIKGLMDNLAWAVVLELNLYADFDATLTKNRRRVGLFNAEFLNQVRNKFPEFYKTLKAKERWNTDLKSLRDPIAHRVPIYAVPSFLNKEEAEEYQRKYSQAINYLNRLDLEEVERLFDEIKRLGTYVPVFHVAESNEQKLYPVNVQVESDLDNVTVVTLEVIKLFKNKEQ